MSAARGCNKLQTDRADQFVESLKLDDHRNLSFKGDYRLFLSNFVLDIPCKRIHLSTYKYTFLEREFYKEHIGNVKF